MKLSTLRRVFGPTDALNLALSAAVAIGLIWIGPRTIEAALGLPATREDYATTWEFLNQRRAAEKAQPGTISGAADLKWLLSNTLLFGVPALVLMAPGAALATVRRPGVRLRRLCRGVGVLTTIISGGMVAVYIANDLILRRFSETLGGFGNNRLLWLSREIADQVSVALLALWVVLALAGLWHAEPHWRDRLGRVLGSAWIAYWVLDSIVSPLWGIG